MALNSIKLAAKYNEINASIGSLQDWKRAREEKKLPVQTLDVAISLLSEYVTWADTLRKKSTN